MNRNAVAKLTPDEMIDKILTLQEQVNSLETQLHQTCAKEALYQSVLDTLPYSVFRLDADHRGVYFNRAILDTIGPDTVEADLIGVSPRDVYTPELAEKYIADNTHVLQARKSMTFIEDQVVPATGEKITVEVTKSPVLDDDGNVIGVQGVFFDVTERERLSAALAEAESTMRTIINASPGSVLLLDTDGTIICLSPYFAETVHSTPEALVGKNIFDQFTAEKADIRRKRFERLKWEKKPLRYESETDGVYRETILVPILDDSHEVTRIAMYVNDITEQHRVQEELRESRALYRLVVDHYPNGSVALFDHDLRFIIAGGSGFRAIGMSSESIIGKRLSDVFPPEVAERDEPRIQATLAGTESAYNVEYMGNHYVVRATPVKNERGKVIAGLVVSQDVTELKAAEAALKASHATAQALINAPIDSVYLVSDHGEILAINETAARLLGSTLEAVRGKSIADLMDKPVFERRVEQVKKVYETGQPVRYTDYRGDLWFDSVIYPIYDDQQEQITRFAVVSRNITEEKKMQEQLRQNEARFRGVFENAAEGIAMGYVDGVFSDANQRFLDIIGYTRDDLPNLKPSQIIHPDDWAENARLMNEIKSGKRDTYRMEKRYIKKDGTPVWVHITVSTVRNAEGELQYSFVIAEDINERKEAELALKESEARYRSLFENVPIPVFTKDKEGRYTSMNAANRFYFQDDIIGKTDEQVFSPAIAQQLREHDQLIMETADLVIFEETLTTPEGEKRYFITNKVPLYDHKGAIQGIMGASLDITERKTMEDALRESESRYRSLFYHAPVNVYTKDLEGRYTSSNDTDLIYSERSAIGLTDYDIQPEHLARQLLANDRQVMESGEEQVFEEQVMAFDGIRELLAHKVPLLNADNEVIGVLGASQDITARKLAENRLREREHFITEILTVIPEYIYIFDLYEDCHIFGNRSVMLTGHTLEDYQQMSHEQRARRIFAEDLARVRTHQSSLLDLQPGQWQAVEYRVNHINSDIRWIHLQEMIFKCDDDGIPLQILGVAQDITERRKSQEAFVALEAERARTHVIANFIQDASHLFRTPLSVINASIHLMMRLKDEERKQYHSERIEEQVHNITNLVDALVTMSRLDSSNDIRHDTLFINGLIRETMVSIQSLIDRRGHTVDFEQAPDNPKLRGDASELHLAFKHILSNAIRYSPEGSTITVQVHPMKDSIQITCHNTGPAIQPDDLPHIFERFYRSDKAHSTSGFGLGLPIARKVIERHGGTIEVHSSGEEGTTFTVTIPVAPPVSSRNPVTQQTSL